MCKTNERLRLENCSDCYDNSVVVAEDYEGSAYCSECMTQERLKETQPSIYAQALKETNQ